MRSLIKKMRVVIIPGLVRKGNVIVKKQSTQGDWTKTYYHDQDWLI
jgi:hypothetical protein